LNRRVITAIVLVVLVVALGVPAFLLYDAFRAFSGAEQRQKSAWQRLSELYGQKPFPSESNIEIDKENVRAIDARRKGLINRLSQTELVRPHKTPSTFQIFLSETRKQLFQAAVRSGASVPENFAFGFGAYADSGALPSPLGDVPSRLAEQLTIVDYLCRILFDEKVHELNAVQREEVESGLPDVRVSSAPSVVPSGPGRPGRPAPRSAHVQATSSKVGDAGAGETHRKLHFALEFKAKERSVVGIINRFAKDPMFIVVTGVELERTGGETVGSTPGSDAPRDSSVPAPAALSRQERQVSGPEMEAPVRVRLDVDVYRFNEE
jgi:hypothetical protein